MINFGFEKPPFIEVRSRLVKYYVVNINILETLGEGGERFWTWETVELPSENMTKEEIINVLISFKYPPDEISRINFSLSCGELGSKFDYEGLLCWKEEASKIADKVLNELCQNR